MPVIQLPITALAANISSGNVLGGNLFEFVPSPSLVNFLFSGSATGLVVDVLIGGVTIANRAAIAATNRSPVRPDDMLVFAPLVVPGQRLFIEFHNTTGGALNFFALIDIQPR